MILDDKWFTEASDTEGIGLSLKINKKLHAEKTKYQLIEIYETTNFGNLMVIDGFVMLTTRDNFIYHEMMTHPALFCHQNPESILIIGGGDCGTLKETLKHTAVKNVLQVEIDERVTRLAEIYFPELCESNTDPRAEFYFGDGIQWVSDQKEEKIDLIIIDSTDPVGPAKGLFCEAFYKNCLKILRPNGLIVQQSESPLIHQSIITAMQKEMTAAGFADIKMLTFPQSTYPSGWWSATIAGKSIIDNASDFNEIPFATKYYNRQIHQACFANPAFFNKPKNLS